jgi:hypothetical protein
MSTKLYIIALAAILAAGSFVVPAYAQEMEQPTSGGTLDIELNPEPDQNNPKNVRFHVTFIDPATGQPHQHQDYDFVILQGDTEIFRASEQTGQQVLHNVEGTLTVPYEFEQTGDYTTRVELHGLGLPPVPIAPEQADFSVTVTPEFPAGALGAVSAVMAGTIAVARIKMKR